MRHTVENQQYGAFLFTRFPHPFPIAPLRGKLNFASETEENKRLTNSIFRFSERTRNNFKRMYMENERNLMTTTEAARYLGLKPSYLYKMMMRRAIPYYKPGGKLCFFDKEDLDAWLKRVRVKSQDEIDSEASRYLVEREKNK